jgi:hypothetical protein
LTAVILATDCRDAPVPLREASVHSAPYIGREVSAADKSVLGIAVSALDSTWATASLLQHAGIISDSGANAFADSSVRVPYLEADLDRDGRPERVYAGVFRTRDGKKGSFVIVVSPQNGHWINRHVTSMTGGGDLTFVRRVPGDTIVWSDCLQCDAAAAYIYWNKKAFAVRVADE